MSAALFKAELVPLEFRGASLYWRILFHCLSYFRSQLTEFLLTQKSASVHSEVGAVEGLPFGGGVKPGAAVVRVEGLLWFGASSAVLTSLAELGTGLAQVSRGAKSTTVHRTTSKTEDRQK